VTKHIAVQYNQ